MLDLRGDLGALFQSIVDTESVSGHEAALADALEAALRGVAHLAVDRVGDTVIARTELGRGRRVAVAGHIDTVPLAGNLPSRWDTRDGERVLWGRGSVDMKGGVAVQAALAAALAAPRFDVTWIFYDHEEVDATSNALYRLAAAEPERLAADFAILMEPTAAAIEGGCQGNLRALVRTAGLAAHSARSWKGHNAIHDLARALVLLQAFEAPLPVVDGLEYHEGLNAVGVQGGIAGNIIPDRATLTVNYRFAPDRSEAEAVRIVTELFDGYDVEVVDLAGGARPGLDTELAQELVAASGVAPRAKYGWTDVARFAALGIPAVNFGPGDPNLAHTDDEHCPLSQLEACYDALATWLD
jgi:succinyl-diaminopimelate desuccinylase